MDILLIVFLTLLNGAFAMSELALASSRKARLAAMAEAGDKGSITALKLLENPTQFLSSVQVGITSIGMLNGIVGEAAFSGKLALWLQTFGMTVATANVTATAVVVVVITFITIVFGELVPKRIGQLYPETVSRWVSRPMAFVAKAAKPFVWLLTQTTQGMLKLLRIDTNAVQHVTEEEINASLEEGVDAGIIEEHEHQMVRNVFLLDDRQLTSIMVPHAEIKWLDAQDSIDDAVQKAWTTGHSWYPVCRGGLDDVVGVIHLPRMLALQSEGNNEPLMRHVQPAVFVPETLTGMELLEQFRERATRMVLVVDEYGVVQGLLTPLDMLEAITGELSPEAAVDAWATQREDGAWLVDGAMPVAELKARLDIEALPDEDKGRYNTVAGLMQTVAGDLLQQGDAVEAADWRFEVLVLDGRRIDQVLIVRLPGAGPATA
ncbi:MAG: hemolysin family protein [Hydrogenophaga sp.]|jgi:putative hemolysin|uniref:hemolysin family protein n=1 Tax=Hydrogenophaga sp. TaxID=1904254 RepID=UPI0027193826|nr:hemolysin family protein [Hydrogenophaga sp.]MDO9482638.1 hemolysin family protein [Hydrogenophaga sp.]MDO9569653.1 hemolysin family protein [Hydrogenophaga sp.]MDP2221116.1 hemolysin family protein [Hydrogenophaga sp.]MDP3343487.1 hemolysin family protein [Hydrogenophaga sp.]MDP3373467.1 hemolysin family protein [Hydrogenophaga sp.]